MQVIVTASEGESKARAGQEQQEGRAGRRICRRIGIACLRVHDRLVAEAVSPPERREDYRGLGSVIKRGKAKQEREQEQQEGRAGRRICRRIGIACLRVHDRLVAEAVSPPERREDYRGLGSVIKRGKAKQEREQEQQEGRAGRRICRRIGIACLRVHDRLVAEAVSPPERREDYRGLGSLVKTALAQQGRAPVDLRTEKAPSVFMLRLQWPGGAMRTARCRQWARPRKSEMFCKAVS